jgi:hypothetical protein
MRNFLYLRVVAFFLVVLEEGRAGAGRTEAEGACCV